MTARTFVLNERKRLGLSVKKLAELSGVTTSTIYRLESGGASVTMDTFSRLCWAMGVFELPKVDSLSLQGARWT